jgi:flagellar basal-body rod modification protein FlgD
MDIQTNQVSPITTTAATSSAASKITSDFDTFLKMLTTQMQNQDPLNPIDSSDYAVQLATFSGVEQQTRTNQLLAGLGEQFNMMGMTQLAGWVGNEARTAGPVQFSGQSVAFNMTPDVRADRSVLVVTDARGSVVARDEIAPGTIAGEWLGTSITGADLPGGRYQLSVENFREGDLLSTTAVETYARILEVQGGIQGNRLILSGGIEVAAIDVTALRSAS